jgi:Flp pilus assembly protein CpaB
LLALSSALLVALCVAVFASVYLRAGHQVSVIAVARSVPEGQTLTGNDLTIVRMSIAPGVLAIPATAVDSVMGRRVAVPVESGTLLTPGDLAHGSYVPPGDAVVGVALKQGQLPATGVAPGQYVDVVMTGSPGSPFTASPTGGGPGTILAPGVLVSAVTQPSASSGSDIEVVSLVMSRALAPIIASASAANQAALVVIASGP